MHLSLAPTSHWWPGRSVARPGPLTGASPTSRRVAAAVCVRSSTESGTAGTASATVRDVLRNYAPRSRRSAREALLGHAPRAGHCLGEKLRGAMHLRQCPTTRLRPTYGESLTYVRVAPREAGGSRCPVREAPRSQAPQARRRAPCETFCGTMHLGPDVPRETPFWVMHRGPGIVCARSSTEPGTSDSAEDRMWPSYGRHLGVAPSTGHQGSRFRLARARRSLSYAPRAGLFSCWGPGRSAAWPGSPREPAPTSRCMAAAALCVKLHGARHRRHGVGRRARRSAELCTSAPTSRARRPSGSCTAGRALSVREAPRSQAPQTVPNHLLPAGAW